MRRLLLPSLLAVLATGCPDPMPEGSPDEDADGDSYVASRDCDDADPRVWNPAMVYQDADGDDHGAGAAETVCVGYGLPAGYASRGGDCAPDDSERWQTLPYAFRDSDGDGRTVAASGALCGGESLPPGYLTEPSKDDCDDADALVFERVELLLDEDLDGLGAGEAVPLCTDGGLEPGFAAVGGDCAPSDGGAWQMLSYSNRDIDGDGATVFETGTVCSGVSLPPTYLAHSGGFDCDDADPAVESVRFLFPDVDRDGVGVAPSEALCVLDVPVGYVIVSGDCAADDATHWQTLGYQFVDADNDGFGLATPGSVCSGAQLPSGFTNSSQGADCDDADPGLAQKLFGHGDEDSDGVGAGTMVALCTNGTLPAGFVTTTGDCAPSNATAWQIKNGFMDADDDGFTLPVPTPLCISVQLPLPFRAARNGNDCNDSDATRFRNLALYPDADGDGVGAPPRQVHCLGTALPSGMSIYGDDVDDDDPTRAVDEDENDSCSCCCSKENCRCVSFV